MRTLLFVLVLFAAACGNKKEGGSGGDQPKPVEVEKPIQCNPGEAIEAGRCVQVITVDTLDAVQREITRLDELGTLLDKVNVVAVPIELANTFRKLDEWKSLVAKFDQLKVVDTLVAELDNAVKTLQTFRASLDQAETRLGNLAGELAVMMKTSGASKKIEDLRAEVGKKLRETLEPLGQQVADTIQNALAPLMAKLEQIEGLIQVGCGGLKISGGSADAKKICEQAQVAFVEGKKFLTELKDRPAQMFTELVTQLETKLERLVDDASKQAIDAAQAKVNELLKLPSAGSGSATP